VPKAKEQAKHETKPKQQQQEEEQPKAE